MCFLSGVPSALSKYCLPVGGNKRRTTGKWEEDWNRKRVCVTWDVWWDGARDWGKGGAARW